LIPVPEDLDPAEAVSLVLSYVTAYQMLHRIAKIKEGQRILIHGAGGAVGTAMIQLGKLLNLEIYGTASQAKHDVVSRLGAIPINYQTEDFVHRIYELTHDGVDAAFDPIGGDTLKRSFSVLRDNGILVSYGFYNAVMGKGGNILWDLFRLKVWDLLPNRCLTKFYSIGELREKQPSWFAEDLTTLFDLLKQGKIKPIIAQRISLSEIKQAHEWIAGAKVQGKVIVQITPVA
jgi:NADPH:quinone reductase-like Zn-dependent oxidoreductase